VILPGGGYAPSDRTPPGTPPGTPPTGPAGASSANPAAPCACRYPQNPHTGNGHATINPQEQ
jgi:hypothetical protein